MKKVRLLALILVLLLVFASCSQGTTPSSSAGTDAPASSSDSSTSSEGSTEEITDPATGQSEELITITAVNIIDSMTQDRVYNATGESPEDNRWTKLIAERLGYKIEYLWLVNDQEQYDQKFNTSIAVGDIPDIVRLNKIQFGQAMQGDVLAEMGSLYDEYASPLLKEIVADAGPLPVTAATVDGKLMALPVVDADIERGGVMWVRQDWLDQIGAEAPTTIDEMIDVMTKFKEIAGDGAVGLALEKKPFEYNSQYRINQFCNAFGAYPQTWIEKDGQLVYGSVQPEMKEALAKLNEIYNLGLIDTEFIVKDGTKVNEAIASGKNGLFYGAHWSSLNAIQDCINNDPEAWWEPIDIPSVDGTPVKVGLEMATNVWFGASVNCSNPEVVIQLANLYCEKTFDPELQEYEYYSNPGGNAEGLWKLSPVYMMTPLKNIDTTRAIRPYLEAGDRTGGGELYGEQLTMLQYAYDGRKGGEDRLLTGWNRVFGIDGSCEIQGNQWDNGNYVTSAFYAAPTETMASSKTILDSAFDAEVIKIISGQSPVDAFDAAVEAWLSGGGQKMTDEVNEWYQAQ
ncbi:MAG: hypothetical protein ACK5LX_02950 [Oscillospiraceae bacterium]